MTPLPFQAIAFDIDDTLSVSKQSLQPALAQLLVKLSFLIPIGIISGAKKDQILTQLMVNIEGAKRENFFLFPNGGAGAYTYTPTGELVTIYEHAISEEEAKKITAVAEKIIADTKINEGHMLYGEVVEWRGPSVAISLLGQTAPPEIKKDFDPNQLKRLELIKLFKEALPEFSYRIGGGTTIDINQPGIDKAFGMREFSKLIAIPEENILYVGDALYEGGNDYAVLSTNLKVHAVKNPEDTERFLSSLFEDVHD